MLDARPQERERRVVDDDRIATAALEPSEDETARLESDRETRREREVHVRRDRLDEEPCARGHGHGVTPLVAKPYDELTAAPGLKLKDVLTWKKLDLARLDGVGAESLEAPPPRPQFPDLEAAVLVDVVDAVSLRDAGIGEAYEANNGVPVVARHSEDTAPDVRRGRPDELDASLPSNVHAARKCDRVRERSGQEVVGALRDPFELERTPVVGRAVSAKAGRDLDESDVRSEPRAARRPR